MLPTKLLLFLIVAPIGIVAATVDMLRPAPAISTTGLPLNPDVTPATIGATICRPGWAKRARPSVAITRRIKLAKLQEAGLEPRDARRFELDHRIPIDLGGALADPRNLALEPWPEAREKDDVELCLSLLVCADQISLDAARAAIWTDWRRAGRLCK